MIIYSAGCDLYIRVSRTHKVARNFQRRTRRRRRRGKKKKEGKKKERKKKTFRNRFLFEKRPEKRRSGRTERTGGRAGEWKGGSNGAVTQKHKSRGGQCTKKKTTRRRRRSVCARLCTADAALLLCSCSAPATQLGDGEKLNNELGLKSFLPYLKKRFSVLSFEERFVVLVVVEGKLKSKRRHLSLSCYARTMYILRVYVMLDPDKTAGRRAGGRSVGSGRVVVVGGGGGGISPSEHERLSRALRPLFFFFLPSTAGGLKEKRKEEKNFLF